MFDLNKIRFILKEKGKTIRWLAAELNYKDAAIHKMFKTNNTTVSTVENICRILEINPVRLLEDGLTDSSYNQKQGEKMTSDEFMFFYNQLRKDYDSERGRVDSLIESVNRFSRFIENPPPNGQKKAV